MLGLCCGTWDLSYIMGSLSLECSVQLLGRVQLFVTPWTAARQDSLSITNSRTSPKLMSIEKVMLSNHLILSRPLLLLPLIFLSIRVFSNESALRMRWPKYWSAVPSPSPTVQFISVTQSCPNLCNPMDCSTPGLPVHHQLPGFTQTHVH